MTRHPDHGSPSDQRPGRGPGPGRTRGPGRGPGPDAPAESADAPGGERVPVLVVGGSLVGLSASVFLGRLGVPHVLVERHARTSHHPRGRGNNVRTMELFRTAGVEPAIRDAASVLAGNHGILQADTLTGADQEWLFRQIDPGNRMAAISPSGWCLCSQNDLEPVLLDAARDLGGDIRFGVELIDCAQDREGVTAVVRDRATGEDRTVRADYLIAADGPRSPVRERLGIAMTGPGELFHNVSITFRAKALADVVGDRRFIVCYLTNPAGPGALLPVDNAQDWVFHAPWRPGDGETLEDFTDERCAELIRTATGVPDLDVEITGKAPWHAAERTAAAYRAGRVLLAGDSAHEMSPTGAFGSNTGIQDAHNLAWKLAAVLAGWAGPGLLDTYDAERRPVALATGARASARSAEHRHPGYDVGVGGGGAGGPRAGMLAVVLGYGYGEGGAVHGADPAVQVVPDDFRPVARVGGRAPHMWLRRGGERVEADALAVGPGTGSRRGGERLSTLDLYETVPVLLCGPRGAAWHDAAPRAAATTGVPLTSYVITRDLHPLAPPASDPRPAASDPPAAPASSAASDGRPASADPSATSASRLAPTAAPAPSDARPAGPPARPGTADSRPAGPPVPADWAALHGVTDAGCVLVRPDGFVAWSAQGAADDPQAALESALRAAFRLP